MGFDTVYAVDFWVKAQGPLEVVKTHENWENMMKTHDPCPFQSQKDSGSSPTTQTREGTTLLMWFKFEEYGLVEGSESQDFGSH